MQDASGSTLGPVAAIRSRRRVRGAAAFSLIEVVFSLAICSFAFVGMLGLMTLGLTTLRQSIDYNTEVAISQQLTGEAELLDYSAVTNTTSAYRANFSRNRFFDNAGREIDNTTTPANYVYKATLLVQACKMPGTTVDSPVAQQLIFKISTPSNTKSVSSYNLWTVDNGR